MSKNISKLIAGALVVITAATSTVSTGAADPSGNGIADLQEQIAVIGQAAETTEDTLKAQVPDYEIDDSFGFVTNIASLSDTVYTDDFSGLSDIGDAAIADAVAEYKAEQARIAAEKAAAEEAARRKQAVSPGSHDVSAERQSRSGMVGRLYIPSINMTPVACIDSYQQSVTDAADSANIWKNFGGIVIADHVHQNFSPLKYVRVGTTATIDCGNGTYTLECVEVNSKFYCGPHGDFREAFNKDDLYGYIVMYTCNGWPNVTATLWRVTSGGYESLYSRVTAGF